MRPWIRSRRGYLSAAVVLLLLLGAGVALARRDHFDGRRLALAGLPFDLVVAPGVSDAEVRTIEDGLRIADGYLREQAGQGVTRRVEVRVARDQGRRRGMPPTGQGTAWALPDLLCVNTGSSGWQTEPDDGTRAAVVVHEHVHNVQGQLGCFPAADEHRWLWLFEGMAEHLAERAMVSAGRRRDTEIGARLRRMGVNDPALGPLAGFERTGAGRGDPAYALFHLAVRTLAGWSTGPRGLLEFCRLVAADDDWQAAFATAFGMPVQTFYQRFAAERDAFRQQG